MAKTKVTSSKSDIVKQGDPEQYIEEILYFKTPYYRCKLCGPRSLLFLKREDCLSHIKTRHFGEKLPRGMKGK